MSELIEAKKKLYGLLIKLKKPTEREIDIMYDLSRDTDIQRILRNSIGN